MAHPINGALMKARGRVLVHNNFLFGMAAGQNSDVSPVDLLAVTTRDGAIEGAAAGLDGGGVSGASAGPPDEEHPAALCGRPG